MSETEKLSDELQGEGNHDTAHNFDRAEAEFVKSGAVPHDARRAADALHGREAEELEAARMQTDNGDTSTST